MSEREYTIVDEDHDIRLDRWFKRNVPEMSHGLLQKNLRKGDIRLDGKKAQTSTRVVVGQRVSVRNGILQQAVQFAKEKPAPRTDVQMKLTPKMIQETQGMVLHRDPNALVLNKPTGLAVQGGSNVKDSVDGRGEALRFDGNRPKLVHRLDKDTSGVLLLARHAQAAAEYVKAFAGKDGVTKIYWAVVMGVPELREGTIDMSLEKTSGDYERVVPSKSGKRALTHYRVIDTVGQQFSWVELMPVTGRTHQLRVHMSEIGHPILGDGKYAGSDAFSNGVDLSKTLHLHARRLHIGEIDVTAPLPKHMVDTFKTLGIEEERDSYGVSLADRD